MYRKEIIFPPSKLGSNSIVNRHLVVVVPTLFNFQMIRVHCIFGHLYLQRFSGSRPSPSTVFGLRILLKNGADNSMLPFMNVPCGVPVHCNHSRHTHTHANTHVRVHRVTHSFIHLSNTTRTHSYL